MSIHDGKNHQSSNLYSAKRQCCDGWHVLDHCAGNAELVFNHHLIGWIRKRYAENGAFGSFSYPRYYVPMDFPSIEAGKHAIEQAWIAVAGACE